MITSHSPNLTEKLDGRALGILRGALHGELILPGDLHYETARRVWNGAIDRHPALIVRCGDVNDVQRAVEFGRESHLEVAVRGGGHSFAGFSTCEGGLVIDLSPLKGVSVNPQDRTARAEPGLTLGELTRATQEYGLATTTGTVSDTGVAGLTLGGGLGWLMGKYGLTCDNVRSFDMVTADGRLVQANSNDNLDLYWGLRGGGGNFGIVTAFEYRLHMLGPILGGVVAHPFSRAHDVLRFYRDLTHEGPDELTTLCLLGTGPDGNRIAAIGLCYCGDLTEGERLIGPLRKLGAPIVDAIQQMPYAGLFALLDPFEPAGRHCRNKENAVQVLSDQVIDALVDSAREFTSPFSKLLITNVHGAATRVATSATAFPSREEHYEIINWASWEKNPARDEEHVLWVRQSWQALQPFSSQRAYVNFLDDEGTARVRAAYGPNYERLVAVKTKYDPDNLFHLNQNIKPDASIDTRRRAGLGQNPLD